MVDYRALNRITKKKHAPLPRTDEMFDRLGGAQVFFGDGFRIRLSPNLRTTPRCGENCIQDKVGHYEFLVMPIGLCNAPATFQSLMNNILRDHLDEFIVVYIDDLLVFSKTKEEHYGHVEIVLS